MDGFVGNDPVSVLFNEPKLLKCDAAQAAGVGRTVSVLFNEPKLLKFVATPTSRALTAGFSALQRAEIAEMLSLVERRTVAQRVSVLFNEPKLLKSAISSVRFSNYAVSVLFNEPKLLKCTLRLLYPSYHRSFSALQRAEIAEIVQPDRPAPGAVRFQCSSTSRNC